MPKVRIYSKKYWNSNCFTDIRSVFGGAMINLDSCGDSTPRYAIYQLDENLNYRKIGTWNHNNGNSNLKLNQNVIPLVERKEQCLPLCVSPDKPITLQRVRKERNIYSQIIYDPLLQRTVTSMTTVATPATSSMQTRSSKVEKMCLVGRACGPTKTRVGVSQYITMTTTSPTTTYRPGQ